MRKQHNVKSTPSFTRAFVELELFQEVTTPMAYVDGQRIPQVNIVHAWTRGSLLADLDSALEFTDAVRAEHHAIPVLHKMRREPCLDFCLPGVLGELMAS